MPAAKDVMTKDVVMVDGLASVLDAAKLMKEKGVRALVVDRRGPEDAYGMVTQRDIVYKVISPGADPAAVKVHEIMSKPLVVINPDLDLRYVARLMANMKLSRAPVIRREAAGRRLGHRRDQRHCRVAGPAQQTIPQGRPEVVAPACSQEAHADCPEGNAAGRGPGRGPTDSHVLNDSAREPRIVRSPHRTGVLAEVGPAVVVWRPRQPGQSRRTGLGDLPWRLQEAIMLVRRCAIAVLLLLGVGLLLSAGCQRSPQAPSAASPRPTSPPTPTEPASPTAGQAASTPEAEKGVAWLDSLAEAKAKAQAEGKPLVIDFYTIPCPPCEEFEDKVVPSAEVSRYADAFVWVSINGEEDTDASGQFAVKGYPTIIVMRPDGEVLYRKAGLPTVAEFAGALKKASASRRKSASYAPAPTRPVGQAAPYPMRLFRRGKQELRWCPADRGG